MSASGQTVPLAVTLSLTGNSLKSGHDRLRGQRCRCQSDECLLLYRLCQRTYDSAGPKAALDLDTR